MAKQVKIGLVGCGGMGRIHVAVLQKDERVNFVGLYDFKAEVAEKAAAARGTQAFASYDQLLDAVDAVYVATPNTTHADYVCQALDRNKHVFSEKPPCVSVPDMDRIAAAVEKSEGLYQIGFNERFAPAYDTMKQLINDGKLSPLSAQIKMNRGELQNPPWVSDKSYTGGFLYESTIHLIDMALYMMGDVSEIVVRAKKSLYPDYDDFAMIWTFKSGAIATFTSCAHTTWINPFERFEMYGDHASAFNRELDSVHYCLGLNEEVQMKDFSLLSFEDKRGYVVENRMFVDAILGQGEIPVTVKDAHRVIQIIEGIYAHLEEGRTDALTFD